jgi:hypothetical protein
MEIVILWNIQTNEIHKISDELCVYTTTGGDALEAYLMRNRNPVQFKVLRMVV